ncbi:MAG: hypothetical protein H7A33_02640 [Deltaproteobacteria bacterium]|nr:hypothetical protein [Deltaproteobacteria bacterium]
MTKAKMEMENMSNMETWFDASATKATKNLAHQSVITLDDEDHSGLILNLLEDAIEKMSQYKDVSVQLNQVKTLLHFDLPVEARIEILEKMNIVLGAACLQQIANRSSFNLCHSIMTLINFQIDKENQYDLDDEEKEWEELEKSIYLLCYWEDELDNERPQELMI